MCCSSPRGGGGVAHPPLGGWSCSSLPRGEAIEGAHTFLMPHRWLLSYAPPVVTKSVVISLRYGSNKAPDEKTKVVRGCNLFLSATIRVSDAFHTCSEPFNLNGGDASTCHLSNKQIQASHYKLFIFYAPPVAQRDSNTGANATLSYIYIYIAKFMLF